MEHAFRKRDSGVAQVAPYDRPLQERCDREGRGGRRRCFRGSRSCEKAQGCELPFFRLKDEGVYNSALSTESGRDIASGFITT